MSRWLDRPNDRQDFDEKRREWRRTKKNVINAISEISARALKFECSERKTIALHAIQFYKVQTADRLQRPACTAV